MALEGGSYSGSYAYTLNAGETGRLTTGWSYASEAGTRFEPQGGHWSYWTQAIGNAYPHWHAARKNEFGRTQTFINHAGIGLEGAHREQMQLRRNMFIGTADTFLPGAAHAIPVTRELRLAPEAFSRHNILQNPDFSISGLARTKLPWAWSKRGSDSTGTVELYSQNSLVGTNSMRISCTTGQKAYLHQTLYASAARLNQGDQDITVTGSFWVLVPAASGYAANIGEITVTLGYEDGTGVAARASLPSSTNGAWKRLDVSVVATNRVSSADLMITVESVTDEAAVFVDAAQLEAGAQVRSWAPNPNSVPHWLVMHSTQPRSALNAPVYVESVGAASSRTTDHLTGYDISYDEYEHNKIWVTSSVDDWWESALPTRVSALSTPILELEAITQNVWGFRADPHSRRRRTNILRISGNRIQRVDLLTTNDVWAEYQIAEPFLEYVPKVTYGIWDKDDTGYDIDLEALTIHRDRLWVVARETYQGTTRRVLKICKTAGNSFTLADTGVDNYLELLQDWDLGPDTGTCTAIGFSEGDDSTLVVEIDSGQQTTTMYYDYGYWTPDQENQVLIRHDYGTDTLVMT